MRTMTVCASHTDSFSLLFLFFLFGFWGNLYSWMQDHNHKKLCGVGLTCIAFHFTISYLDSRCCCCWATPNVWWNEKFQRIAIDSSIYCHRWADAMNRSHITDGDDDDQQLDSEISSAARQYLRHRHFDRRFHVTQYNEIVLATLSPVDRNVCLRAFAWWFRIYWHRKFIRHCFKWNAGTELEGKISLKNVQRKIYVRLVVWLCCRTHTVHTRQTTEKDNNGANGYIFMLNHAIGISLPTKRKEHKQQKISKNCKNEITNSTWLGVE